MDRLSQYETTLPLWHSSPSRCWKKYSSSLPLCCFPHVGVEEMCAVLSEVPFNICTTNFKFHEDITCMIKNIQCLNECVGVGVCVCEEARGECVRESTKLSIVFQVYLQVTLLHFPITSQPVNISCPVNNLNNKNSIKQKQFTSNKSSK